MKIAFNFEKTIKSIVDEKPDEVIAQATASIINVYQFDILMRQYFEKLWQSRNPNNQTAILCISEEDIEKIDFSTVISQDLFISDITTLLEDNNVIKINSQLQVIESEKITNSIPNNCYEISKTNTCVFFLSEYAIKVFIRGEVQFQNSLFVDEKDVRDYSNKKDISQIGEVFLLYQEELNKQNVELDIFLKKATVIEKNLCSQNIGKSVLQSNPEIVIKENLKDFLNKNIRRTFNMNYILSQSKRQIDIYTEDIDFYFFTVKWLGTSVSECGTKLNSSHTDYDARCGVTQTLEYIKELIEVEGFSEKTLKKGCLVVIDARDAEDPIQYYNYDYIDVELAKYKKHLEVLNKIKVNRKESA